MHVDHSINFEIYIDAFQSQFATTHSQGQGMKSKPKGKGKGKEHTKEKTYAEEPKYPFSFQFVQVEDCMMAYEAFKTESRRDTVE